MSDKEPPKQYIVKSGPGLNWSYDDVNDVLQIWFPQTTTFRRPVKPAVVQPGLPDSGLFVGFRLEDEELVGLTIINPSQLPDPIRQALKRDPDAT